MQDADGQPEQGTPASIQLSVGLPPGLASDRGHARPDERRRRHYGARDARQRDILYGL